MKLDDFLKVKQVRCVDDDAVNHLTIGNVYQVLGVNYDNTIKVLSDTGRIRWCMMARFEPVLDSAENPLQNIELTPEFEVVEPVLADNCQVNIQDIGTDILDTNADIKDTPKFKVGDKVYYGSEPNVLTILEFDVDGWARMDSWAGFVDSSRLCHATQENYERLQATFPDIEFEKPPKPLTGSDLCRAMLNKGWKYVPCYVSNTSDKNAVELDDCGVIYTVNHNGNFQDGCGEIWCHVVPFDPKTGEPLTESILND